MAQLGARLHGMQKVMGSNPIGSIRLREGLAQAESNALSEPCESKGIHYRGFSPPVSLYSSGTSLASIQENILRSRRPTTSMGWFLSAS